MNAARDNYFGDLEKFSSQAFKDHQMKEVGPGHWYLSRKDGQYWTHIVCMGPGIVVWGDIDGVIYSGGPADPVSKVHWLANAHGRYLKEKATIGMSHVGVERFDVDIAIEDLEECLKEAKENEKTDDATALKEAIDNLRCGLLPDRVLSDLHDEISDSWEWLGDIGRVVDPRVFYTHAAVKRLSDLLESEERGSPRC